MNNSENIYLKIALQHLPALNGSKYETTRMMKVLYAEYCILFATEYDEKQRNEKLVEHTRLLNEALAELSLREK